MSTVLHRSYQEALHLRDKSVDVRIADFLDYYLSIHPKVKIPARSDFDPFEIPAAMPGLTLMDVERDPYRFKYRVMGSNVSYNMEFDGTGRYLDEMVPGIETQFPHLDRVHVAETGLPVHRLGQAGVSFRSDFADLERVHLPLAADGEVVDMVLSYFVYFADQ